MLRSTELQQNPHLSPTCLRWQLVVLKPDCLVLSLRRGTYDVLRNEWVVPPADARYINREMGPCSRRAEPLISSNNGSPKPMRKVRPGC